MLGYAIVGHQSSGRRGPRIVPNGLDESLHGRGRAAASDCDEADLAHNARQYDGTADHTRKYCRVFGQKTYTEPGCYHVQNPILALATIRLYEIDRSAAPFPRLTNANNTEERKIDPSTRRPLAPFYEQCKAKDRSNSQSSIATVTKALRVRWNNGLVYGARYVQVVGREGRKK